VLAGQLPANPDGGQSPCSPGGAIGLQLGDPSGAARHGHPGVAAAYGVQAETVKSLAALTHAVKDGLSSDRPHLIEISQRRIGDS
jgi:thiamine pyrophosphate-dependent acetolactate synthase large subunit-like protein